MSNDDDDWIVPTDSNCLVPPGTVLHIRTGDGETYYNVKNLQPWAWRRDTRGSYRIVKYKIVVDEAVIKE